MDAVLEPREVKFVLLGDAGVGKSSLVMRIVNGVFSNHSEPTIGASFYQKIIVEESIRYKCQVWDTAGQEKYHSLAPMYYRGAGAVIVTFDITDRPTFETASHWIDELKKMGPKNAVVALAGNKADLENLREVARPEAESYAESIGAMYIETSAKDGTDVDLLFKRLLTKLPPLEKEEQQSNKIDINSLATVQKPEKKCC